MRRIILPVCEFNDRKRDFRPDICSIISKKGRDSMMYRYLALLGMLLAMSVARAEDWPRFRGPDNNGISKEKGLLQSWPAGGPKILWTAPLGKGYSSMAVAAGRVYTMYQDDRNQYAIAFDEKSGKFLWKTATGPIYTCGTSHNGPRATPTVEGERVYALDGNGVAVCLNVADGKEIWKKNILELASVENIEWGMAQSPFIHGDKILFNPGGRNAAFMALDKKTGNVIWKNGNGIIAGYATPVISKAGGVEQIVFLTGREMTGVRPGDGAVLWSYPWVSMYNLNATSPIVWDDMVFVSAGNSHGAAVIKLDMKNASNPVAEQWNSSALVCHFQLPIMVGDHIYGNKMSDPACTDRNGKTKWEDNGSLPSKCQMTYAEGLFYLYGEGGTIALARLTPTGAEKLGEMNISPGSQRWALPVVANGHLYVRDDKQLYCLDVKAK